MADPTTIFAYAGLRRANAQQAVGAAQQRLARAQAAITAGSAELARQSSAFAALDNQAGALRSKLAAVPTAADGEALLAALEQIIIRARSRRADILQAQSAVDGARADAAAAQQLLSAATAQLSTAGVRLKQADSARKQRDRWKAALAGAPLATIATAADDVLNGPLFADAGTRIAADIPAKLLERARQRLAAAQTRLDQADTEAAAAATAFFDELDSNGGVDGQADQQSAEFLHAEATVREFAAGTQNRFGQAQLLLARVADPQRSPLTPAQNARIHDNALQADRQAAASVEQALAAKLQTMNAAGDTLASEILKAIAAGHNPDDVQAVSDAQDALTQAEADFQTADDAWRAAEQARDGKLAAVAAAQAALALAIQVAIAGRKNPATDAGVIAARAALATAIGDLETAEAAYRQSNHGILHAWEAAVPDTTWQLLADFEDAGQTLTVLQNADPAALVAALDQAEADYVAARIKADTSAAVLEQLDAARIQRAGYQQSAQQNNSLRLFSALRGDR